MPKPVQASSYTFRHLIEGGFLYVDKTRYIYELIKHTIGIYFLARPRRFGKSLLISTLDEIFHGNKDLFQDLWLYDSDYDWQTYPVIRLDFSRERIFTAAELQETLAVFFEEIGVHYNITLEQAPYQRQFRWLIQGLANQGRVVILVDEYDKPIIDNIDNLAEAQRIQEVLRNFYAVIKAMDQYIRFVFITGISKFSKVGVFSAMNNLDDLTIDPRFASLLGITETELTHNFQEYIIEFAQQEQLAPVELTGKIRDFYNGFQFIKDGPSLYNPFSLLQLFSKRIFENYWFETGTPTYLIKLLQQHQYPIEQLEDLSIRSVAFSTYNIESLSIIPLLFQTGYLTIKEYDPVSQRYTLAYPNAEVRDAFLTYLLNAFSQQEHALNETYLWQMVDSLQDQDLDQFFVLLQTFFANIPYDIQLKHEKYYQTIFYLIFKMIGLSVEAEVRTNRGRIDAVIELADHIYLFEFKLDDNADTALQQIEDHTYAQKYQGRGKPVTLVGANFDSQQRQVVAWESR